MALTYQLKWTLNYIFSSIRYLYYGTSLSYTTHENTKMQRLRLAHKTLLHRPQQPAIQKLKFGSLPAELTTQLRPPSYVLNKHHNSRYNVYTKDLHNKLLYSTLNSQLQHNRTVPYGTDFIVMSTHAATC